MVHTTVAQFRTLKLDGLVSPLEEQLPSPGAASMSFEECLELLVEGDSLTQRPPTGASAQAGETEISASGH